MKLGLYQPHSFSLCSSKVNTFLILCFVPTIIIRIVSNTRFSVPSSFISFGGGKGGEWYIDYSSQYLETGFTYPTCPIYISANQVTHLTIFVLSNVCAAFNYLLDIQFGSFAPCFSNTAHLVHHLIHGHYFRIIIIVYETLIALLFRFTV